MGKRGRVNKTVEDEQKTLFRNILVTIVLLMVLIAVASYFYYLELRDLKIALYDAFRLVTHIEVKDSTHYTGILFVISFLGAFLTFYIIITLITLFYEGKFMENLEEVRTMNLIKKMKGHVIICGGGRVGRTVAEELKRAGKPYVIIEQNPEVVEELKLDDFIVIEGNAVEDEFLELANIKEASSIVLCLPSDGDNLLIAVMAKDMNPNIKVIARVDDEKHVKKFKKAGVEEVILPSVIGGKLMAEKVLD